MFHCERVVLTLLLTATILSTLVFTVSADGFELAYDDGGFDYAWSDFYPHGAAVRFTPPALPWRIRFVDFYGLSIERCGNMLFTLEVRDSGFNLVFRRQYPVFSLLPNGSFTWARIPLPNLTVNGDFYICIYPCFSLNATQLWIGVDDDQPISGRSLLVDGENGLIVKTWDEKSGRPRNFTVRGCRPSASLR